MIFRQLNVDRAKQVVHQTIPPMRAGSLQPRITAHGTNVTTVCTLRFISYLGNLLQVAALRCTSSCVIRSRRGLKFGFRTVAKRRTAAQSHVHALSRAILHVQATLVRSRPFIAVCRCFTVERFQPQQAAPPKARELVAKEWT